MRPFTAENKKELRRTLRFGLGAIAAIALFYLIFRIYGVVAPVVIGWWSDLGSLEKLTLYAVMIVVAGMVSAVPMMLLYKKIVLRLKHDSSVRDPERRILVVLQGSIAKLGLDIDRRRESISLPKELNEIFESKCVMLAYNPDEGGVTRFGRGVGSVVRVFVGKIPTYVVTVKHSKQSVGFAETQRIAEMPVVERVVREIERKRNHSQFSATLSILGYGITGLTCSNHFPTPSSQVLLRVVVADRERVG